MTTTNPLERTDSRIPLLIVVPFLAIFALWFWGFQQFKEEATHSGSIDIAATVKTVKIVTDVGNVDVTIGKAGEVSFEANTLRVAKSQEILDQATAAPFKLEKRPSDDPSVLLLAVSPLPEGMVRLPPREQDKKDETSPRLFRQLNVRLAVPVDLGVVIESSQGNIRVDTRQAPTGVSVQKGNLMLLNVAAPLTARNGDGDTIISGQRGPLTVNAHGRTRVTFTEVTGPVRVDNALGEVGVYMPAHSAVQLKARSDTGHVRNAFGLEAEKYGKKGTRIVGALGAGTHEMTLIARAGTMTVATQEVEE